MTVSENQLYYKHHFNNGKNMNNEKKLKELLKHILEVSEVNSGGAWDYKVHQAEWTYIKQTITKALKE